MGAPGKVYVFCNTRDCEGTEWHSMVAIAEDGTYLAGHICSHHGFAAHDMGIDPDGWKRDTYAKHYPQGFEVVWIEDPTKSNALDAALAAGRVASQADGKEG
jgi:hypothetical protein